MTTAAVKAFGATLQWNSQTVAELTDIGMPGIKTTSIDVSNEQSTGAFREFIAGMHDGGSVAVKGNWILGDTNGQVAMAADAAAGTKRTVVITGVSFTWTFTAFLTDFQPAGALDREFNFTATMKVSGQPVLGVTASADATTIAYEDSVGVKTSLPVFASSTYGPYTVTVATASTYIKITVTDATAVTIVATALGVAWNLTTAVESGQIIVGAAGTTTTLTIVVTDSGKVSKTYTVYVVRP